MRQFIITKSDGNRTDARWSVTEGSALYGDYLSERDAMLDAVDAAWELGESGTAAQVLMRDSSGAETRWTYGADPYPLAAVTAQAV